MRFFSLFFDFQFFIKLEGYFSQNLGGKTTGGIKIGAIDGRCD